MRKLFLHIMVSLDGYIEGPNRELDWHFSDDEFEEYINDVLRSIDGMFFGRVAYELLAGYWPGAETNPTEAANKSDPRRHVEAARMMNTLPKYAVSNTLRGTAWNNSHIVSGDIAAEINKLKAQPGKDLALFAGASLATSARRLGLIDEYRLVINPVLLGGGKRLFDEPADRLSLRLVETRPFKSGAMTLTYRPER